MLKLTIRKRYFVHNFDKNTVKFLTIEIIRLCRPLTPINGATRIDDIPDLDSVRLVELVLLTEQMLGVEIDYARLDSITCVADLAAAFTIAH
jgi:acyl carrier protein